MNTTSIKTALIAAVIVAIGAFAFFSIGGATAQQACIQPLAGNGAVNGTWDSSCVSENTPLGDHNYPSGTRYALFYTFTLSAPSTVTMELKSSTDTYMYLMQGKGKTGEIEHYNDDIAVGENTNSLISESLLAGDYTIEATTYDVETTGNFTLTVSGLPDASTPAATPTTGAGNTPTATPTSISGQATPTVTQTRTATPTITPAPTQPPALGDVLNRLTALETRAATQQGVIATLESKVTALDGRVATLEAGASTPTPTPITIQATPAPEPTQTPTPMPTATNTPTPQPGNLGTRSNPVQLGQYFRAPSSPWELKVVSVDWDAWPEIEAESQFNDPPGPGNNFVMITVEVRNRGTNADSFGAYAMSLVGSRNVEYEGSILNCHLNSLPNEFDYSARIFPNGRLSGTICYEVLTTETASLVMFGDYYDFDLTDRDYRDALWFWNLR